jgi:hypothetical protein
MTGINIPLLVAGFLAVLGAAIHGVGGEILVVQKLRPQMLPPSRFGGPTTTMNLIRGTWHMTTVAFLAVGSALLLSGSVLHGDTARGASLVAAGASSGFAALALGTVLVRRRLQALYRHPAPAMLTAIAVLAWWGAL